MSDVTVLMVGEAPPDAPPDPAVADIWPRAGAVLRHYAWLNTDEARVRDLQFGILQQGAFLAPSLFHDGGDFCRDSFAFQHRVFYRFADGPEEYFWITFLLDRCYALSVLYLPARRLALSLYPFATDAGMLNAFDAMRAGQRRPAVAAGAPAAPPVTVVGFHHIIHHLWNELPALGRAVAAGLAPRLRIVATHQPMGPLDQIFPELRGRVEALPTERVQALHESVEMFTALGAWSIPREVQERVIRVARRLTPPEALAEQERFRAAHDPVFWLSVKPPERTVAGQAAALAAIIAALHARHPGAGFLLNGVSTPWDWANPNYGQWFRDILSVASAQTADLMAEIMALLPATLRPQIRVVSDVSVMEEVTWASLADFYFCHGGSMQNKIGWLHPIPGVMHSNASFVGGARSMVPPVERPVPVYYLPDGLVQDEDPAGYTAMQLARKDQRYRFTDIAGVAAFILDRFAASRPDAAGPKPIVSTRFLEDLVAPMIDDEARIALAARPRDCDGVPKVPGAGEVRLERGRRVQVMHNGLRVVADGYCGAWMTRLITLCRGHHEAQEERMFHEVVRRLPPDATMIELGGYWAYYSLWFLHGAPGRRAVLLEPDPRHSAVGRENAALNGLAPAFVAGLAGLAPERAAFTTEAQGEIELPCFTVDQLMREHAIDVLDLLHCDIQGPELAVLESCAALFAEGRVRWVFISTHAEPISGDALTHQRCLASLQQAGAMIEAEHDVHESFSGDGLIVARFGPAPAGWSPVSLSLNRYSESLFRNPLYDLALSRRESKR